MKYRTSLYVFLGLLLIALAGIWFFYRWETEAPAQVFTATINRDCAPWDAAAFTVSIPLSDGATIHISIYRSPDLKLPASFSFPDETMREGNAWLLPPVGLPEQLAGSVSFQRVDEAMPVEGGFQFSSEAGAQFEGRFVAEWGHQIIYCG
jgi:hypothetical protein